MTLEKSFAISAKTCTLKYNNQEGNGTILGNNPNYIIPIYQRPYSWTEEQLRKFISDIFISFWGNDANSIQEPMFIGTMQLTAENENKEQEIIDGQQRLTTFLILLKILKVKYPNCDELGKINLNWLTTRVNNGRQQLYLQEVIADINFTNYETLNPYIKNALFINELIEEQIKDENSESIMFNIDQFVNHLLGNIYFVVIETRAGLSKTLQIFNSINTTGLDLNGGDIFKIRMYEYLKDKRGRDESAFDEISMLYQKIDENNQTLKYNAIDFRGILGIYQNILVAKYELPTILYSFGTDTFFERLFDTIFNIRQWDHFKNNVQKVELSIEEINKIIDVRFEWENTWYLTAEDMCCYKLIEKSRYSRYVDLIPILLMFKDKNQDRFEILKLLAKVYFIYSVRFQKSIYEIHNWTYSLIKEIINGTSTNNIILIIKDKIGSEKNHNSGFYDLNWFLSENLIDNATRKNLICRLSAMLEEDYRTTDEKEINNLKFKLFDSPIDIEHIQSYHDSNGERREDIWNEWKENINSIGNLMVLEQVINRSISNLPYEIKTQRYPESKFMIVKNQVHQFENWSLNSCLERKEIELNKILEYIFN
jgi:hypothetical protein